MPSSCANRDGAENERNQLSANRHQWRLQMTNWYFDYESDSQASAKQRLQEELQKIDGGLPQEVHDFMNWALDRLPPAIKIDVKSEGEIGDFVRINLSANSGWLNPKWIFDYNTDGLDNTGSVDAAKQQLQKEIDKIPGGLPQEVNDFMKSLINADALPPPSEIDYEVHVHSEGNIDKQSIYFNFLMHWEHVKPHS
jgi:hypothetical protein